MPAAVLCAALSLSTGALAAYATPPPPGSIQLVDVSTMPGVPSDSGSAAPAVSANGRFVAFVSRSSDLPGATADSGVYLRDTTLGTTKSISGAWPPFLTTEAISDDGAQVVYVGRSTVPGPDGIVNPAGQAVMWSAASGTATLLSEGYEGVGRGINLSVNGIDISASGNAVVYDTAATDVLPGDPYAVVRPRVYKRDEAGMTTLVAYDPDQSEWRPSVSADGRYVAFLSRDDHTALPAAGKTQAYVRDTLRSTTALVSLNSSGTGGGNDDSDDVSISSNGRYVAFATKASDLDTGSHPAGSAVYLRDRATGRLSWEGRDSTGEPSSNAHSPSISSDGTTLVYQADSHIYARTMTTGRVRLISQTTLSVPGNSDSFAPSVTADGHFVAWATHATNFTADSYRPGLLAIHAVIGNIG